MAPLEMGIHLPVKLSKDRIISLRIWSVKFTARRRRGIIIIIIIIRNGLKTISLQTSFGDLIRNGANTICLPKLRLGDIIRNGASTTRYDSIWLPNDGYQFATS